MQSFFVGAGLMPARCCLDNPGEACLARMQKSVSRKKSVYHNSRCGVKIRLTGTLTSDIQIVGADSIFVAEFDKAASMV